MMLQLSGSAGKGLLLVATFLAAYFVYLSVYLLANGNRLTILGRLGQLNKKGHDYQNVREAELDVPLFQRVVRPTLSKLAKASKKLMPAKQEENLQRRLVMAGNPGKLSPYEFTILRYGLGALTGTIAGVIALPTMPLLKAIFVILVVAGLGLLLPIIYVNQKIAGRKTSIQEELPDVLDLLTISVEAGLGFDGALIKVVEKSNGVLAGEFLQVLQEIKKGKGRRDALRDMANRCQVDELSGFIGSVIQADQLGVSISNVLRVQAEQMRMRRRQRAEEKAMKAPVKMLIPLVFFIFPTIFIVLLGPAIIQMLDVF